MNFLWAGMIIVGIGYGAFSGNMAAVSQAALDSAEAAVRLCITMLGVMGFWMGLMEIATKAGIIEGLSKKIQPLFHWLFPRIPIGSKAQEYISTNMIANFLGLGWAATPAGLKAMEELERWAECNTSFLNNKIITNETKVKCATDEMCTFLVINISSLQLIPINIIAYRTQYESVNPTAILGPAIIATAISTVAGIIFCKLKAR